MIENKLSYIYFVNDESIHNYNDEKKTIRQI